MEELKSKQTELDPKERSAEVESLDSMPLDSNQKVSLQEEIEAIFKEFDELFKELADR